MASIETVATFDNLIVGNNNDKAFTAVKEMIVQFPAPKGILLYGPSGTGKTALLRASINEITKNHPGLQVLWLSSEEYIRKLVSSINTRTVEAFRQSFVGSKRIIVIDNLEDFTGRKSTQEDLAGNLFNAYTNGAQVFLVANRYCKSLVVEDLLRRKIPDFTVVDVQLPDQGTLERAWVSLGLTYDLPVSKSYIDFFQKSNVKNYWALNGLFQSYCFKNNYLITVGTGKQSYYNIGRLNDYG